MLGWFRKEVPTSAAGGQSVALSPGADSFGVWRVEWEQPEGWWRYYDFAAVANDGGDEFRLRCFWEQPAYWLEVTNTARGPDDPVFSRMLFADADCGKYVRQVMRIARHDVARRLARLDHLYKDVLIGAGQLCRDWNSPKGDRSAEQVAPADDGRDSDPL